MFAQSKWQGIAIAAAFGLALCGCGRNPYELAPVTGKVLCEGKPAEGGVVVFIPVDAPDKTGREAGNPGPSSIGTVGSDGTFTLMRSAVGAEEEMAGAVIGPHRVTFTPPRTTPHEIHPEDKVNLSPEDLKKLEEAIAAQPVYEPLPCGSAINPDTVDVAVDGNDFSFTLSADKTESQPPAMAPRPGGARQ